MRIPLTNILVLLFSSGILMSQESQKSTFKHSIETNALSFIGGQIGPEVRWNFKRSEYRVGYIVGYRFAYDTRIFRNEVPDNQLNIFKQSLVRGHDFTFGFQYESKNKLYPTFNLIAVLGVFKYNNTHDLCKPRPNYSVFQDYVPCDETKQEIFPEFVSRLGFVMEVYQPLFSVKQFSTGFSFASSLNFINRNNQAILDHIGTPNQEFVIVNQSAEWLDSRNPMLHGLPKKSIITGDELAVTLGFRLGLWVKYTFGAN